MAIAAQRHCRRKLVTASIDDMHFVVPIRLADIVVEGWLVRPQPLRERDRDRTLRPDWFQQPDALGYVAYADRFGGTLDGVAQHVDYLREHCLETEVDVASLSRCLLAESGETEQPHKSQSAHG